MQPGFAENLVNQDGQHRHHGFVCNIKGEQGRHDRKNSCQKSQLQGTQHAVPDIMPALYQAFKSDNAAACGIRQRPWAKGAAQQHKNQASGQQRGNRGQVNDAGLGCHIVFQAAPDSLEAYISVFQVITERCRIWQGTEDKNHPHAGHICRVKKRIQHIAVYQPEFF